MDTKQLLGIVEQYSRNSTAENQEFKVIPIAKQKTVFVEQSGDGGRIVMLTEYKVDGATFWAGYSSRSQTVYISPAI